MPLNESRPDWFQSSPVSFLSSLFPLKFFDAFSASFQAKQEIFPLKLSYFSRTKKPPLDQAIFPILIVWLFLPNRQGKTNQV
jgi:hypothetical protein